MSGANIVADTSLLVNFFNGNLHAKEFLLDNDIWISGITEIEICSFPKATSDERKLIKTFLKQIVVIDLIPAVKEISINLRLTKTLKLPDAIIAATALYLDFPLLTYDKSFAKVKGLNLVLLEF